jgi:acid phosphatase (class A)
MRAALRLLKPTAVLLGAALLAACAGVQPPTAVADIGEVRPGLLNGYLDRAALPDSLALVPPPPAPDSPAFAADQAAYRATRALLAGPRGQLAARDARLDFPAATEAFACAAQLDIGPQATPHLTTLMRRTLVDAGLATYRAKDKYQRTRPFVLNQHASCTPAEEAKLAKDGSYPSGHSALGWAWGLVLAELMPERADALVQRGHAFGQSRVVCGVHWQSDVDAGRVVGAAAVARLHADPVFRAQMRAAAGEIRAARAAGRGTQQDCAAEAAALQP